MRVTKKIGPSTKPIAPTRPTARASRHVGAVEEPKLRPYTQADRDSCQRIAGLSTDYAHALDDGADAIEVAVLNGDVIGFAHIQVWAWNHVAWVGDILIEEQLRNRGIGSQLLQRIEERARELGCKVIMDSPPMTHPAVNYYIKRGYRICGFNDRYYADTDVTTAIFVCKELT